MAGPVANGGMDPKMGAKNMEQKKPVVGENSGQRMCVLGLALI